MIVLQSAWITYSGGWDVFDTMFNSRFKKILEKYMVKYWQGAIRLPKHATEVDRKRRLQLLAVFMLYSAIHVGLFLTLVLGQLAMVWASGEQIRLLIPGTVQMAATAYVPCMRDH